MKAIEFRCPGKVFILGEYAALRGTPALIGAIEPDFRLQLSCDPGSRRREGSGRTRGDLIIFRENDEVASPHARNDESKFNGPSPFHPDSPAGRLYLNNQKLFKDYTLNWNDPYKTPIGVGSSTAQFLLILKSLYHLKKMPLPTPPEILDLYWKYSSSKLRPSGCDLMAQFFGGIHAIKNSPFKIKEYKPLENDVTWLLTYTGEKIKTHEQLGELYNKGFPQNYEPALKELDRIILCGLHAWEVHDMSALGKSLNEFHDCLHEKIG